MAVRRSQNGYTSYDRSVITQYTVTASGRTMNLRKGSPGLLLAHAVRWFDENIRDIDPGIMDDWSYAERPIRGNPDEDSNHASGTAADIDATKWPLGVEPERYLTKAEIAKFKAHLELYEGCIRWGAFYTGRKDPMHLEIDKDEATCNRVWAKINNTPQGVPTEEDDMPYLIHAQDGSAKGVIFLVDGANAYGIPRPDDDLGDLQKRFGAIVTLRGDVFNLLLKGRTVHYV